MRALFGALLILSVAGCGAGKPPAQPPTSSTPAVRGTLSAAAAEDAIRAYYKSLKQYDYDAMKAAVTPDFTITYGGGQFGVAEFEARHRAEEKQRGPTVSRPQRMQYQLVDFKTEVTSDVAISSSRETNPGGPNAFNLIVLKRSGDRWLVHRFYHMMEQSPPKT